MEPWGSWPKGTMVVAPRSHAPPCVLRVTNFPATNKGHPPSPDRSSTPFSRPQRLDQRWTREPGRANQSPSLGSTHRGRQRPAEKRDGQRPKCAESHFQGPAALPSVPRIPPHYRATKSPSELDFCSLATENPDSRSVNLNAISQQI